MNKWASDLEIPAGGLFMEGIISIKKIDERIRIQVKKSSDSYNEYFISQEDWVNILDKFLTPVSEDINRDEKGQIIK